MVNDVANWGAPAIFVIIVDFVAVAIAVATITHIAIILAQKYM